jgi:hypothetical protein
MSKSTSATTAAGGSTGASTSAGTSADTGASANAGTSAGTSAGKGTGGNKSRAASKSGAGKSEGEKTGREASAARPASALSAEQRRRIDEVFSSLGRRDAFQLLEIDRGADARALKRAYFRLSKEFHPDRFYGRASAEEHERLAAIFHALKSAFELLSDDARRAAYLQGTK